MQVRVSEYNQLKAQVNAMSRKQTGNLAVRDLSGVVHKCVLCSARSEALLAEAFRLTSELQRFRIVPVLDDLRGTWVAADHAVPSTQGPQCICCGATLSACHSCVMRV